MHDFFQGGWRTSVPDYRTQVAKQELQNMAEGRCDGRGSWRLGYYKNDEETKGLRFDTKQWCFGIFM